MGLNIIILIRHQIVSRDILYFSKMAHLLRITLLTQFVILLKVYFSSICNTSG